MSEQPTREKWIGNPSIQFMLAAMFLSLGVAWLIGLSGDVLPRLLTAGLLLTAGTVLTVRGVSQLASRR